MCSINIGNFCFLKYSCICLHYCCPLQKVVYVFGNRKKSHEAMTGDYGGRVYSIVFGQEFMNKLFDTFFLTNGQTINKANVSGCYKYSKQWIQLNFLSYFRDMYINIKNSWQLNSPNPWNFNFQIPVILFFKTSRIFLMGSPTIALNAIIRILHMNQKKSKIALYIWTSSFINQTCINFNLFSKECRKYWVRKLLIAE